MATSPSTSGLASSLTDLMTSLAVIFILLLAASLNNYLEKGKDITNQILLKLKEELKEFEIKGVKVESDPKDPLSLLVFVPEGLLEFAFGKHDIPPAGSKFLKEFIPKLAGTICSARFEEEVSSIVVEGHTDSQGTDQYNLPLSQRRSMEVVQNSLMLLNQRDDKAALDLRRCYLRYVSASGRGSSEPFTDSSGKEIKDRSRRVVFKIRVRSVPEMIRSVLPSSQ
jgi:outer membrane protein OmpA-like peptidoglycan-associated protein